VIIAAGKSSFKCASDHVNLTFCRCFNTIYNGAKYADSELACVQLMKSCCLPVLLYNNEAVLPNKSVMKTLDISRAKVYKWFGCSAAEDINHMQKHC